MTPKQTSEALRRIAGAIDNSREPSASLVVSELNRLIAAIDDPFSSTPGDSLDERRQKELERRKQKESERSLEETKKDIGKQVEKLVETEFRDLERKMK